MFRLNKKSISKITLTVFSTIIILSLSYSLASASSISGNDVNFRKGPGTQFESEEKLNIETQVQVLDVEGDWFKVSYKEKVGYINSMYVNVWETNATVNDDAVRMRTTPAFDNNIYSKGRLNKNQRVYVLKKENVDGNEFYSIIFNKQKLYVFCSLINLDAEAKVEDNAKAIEEENAMIAQIAENANSDVAEVANEQITAVQAEAANATVTATVLNVRERPSQYSKQKGQLIKDSRISLTGKNADNATWYCFLKDGVQVWVNADYIKLDESVTLPLVQVEIFTKAKEIVEFAKSFERSHRQEYLNGKQIWFDCSSYVKYVYANFGIALSGGSADIAKSGAGIMISKEERQPGDLVFIHNNGSYIGHVGIYIGDDLMISNESSGVTRYDGTIGGGIKISTLSTGYYWPNYAQEYMRLYNVQ